MSLPINIQFTRPDKEPDTDRLFARVVFQAVRPHNDKLWLIQSGLQQISEVPTCEDWTSTTPVQRNQHDNISYASNEQILFGQVQMPSCQPLDALTRSAYQQVFSTLSQTPYKHLLRVWHYLPHINKLENNVPRYYLFCRGRNEAYGKTAVAQRCAATVIGTQARKPAMFFIASRTAGVALENPQQTNPWEYPGIPETDKPVFARAMKSQDLSILFVSGTTSIIGSESMHISNIAAQIKQIFTHFKELLSAASDTSPSSLEYLKIYLKSADEVSNVTYHIHRILDDLELNTKQIVIFESEICRPELTLEIETMAHL